MSEFAGYLACCEQAARAAGSRLLEMMGRVKVREKGPADLVTEADEAAQATIRDIVLAAYPGHGFLSEENLSIPAGEDGFRWIVDPLDGTTNFVHGAPQFAVSIALTRHEEIVVGTIYDPSADECFSAERGGGARLNGHEIRVSGSAKLEEALVAVSFSAKVKRGDRQIDHFIEVMLRSRAMRRTGSSAINLSYLAAGRYDAYWGTTSKIWDVAAGLLLVEEAGGVVTDIQGGAFDMNHPTFLVAATRPLHDELRAVLRSVEESRGARV